MPAVKDKHSLLRAYCAVVHFGSFNKAAEYLNLPVSSVSKSVKQLEEQYQTQLIIRNTRSMQVTDVGRICYAKATEILRSVDELENEIQQITKGTHGRLRVSLPLMIGESILVPLLCKFQLEYPEINLELDFAHSTSNLIEQDFDVVFRTTSESPDSSLFEIKLLDLQAIYVASPEYLSNQGKPTITQDLMTHNQLLFNPKIRHENSTPRQQESSRQTNRLISNSYASLIAATKSGLGITCIYDVLVQQEIKAGTLIEILKKNRPQKKYLSMLYRQRSSTSHKLQTFVEFFKQNVK